MTYRNPNHTTAHATEPTNFTTRDGSRSAQYYPHQNMLYVYIGVTLVSEEKVPEDITSGDIWQRIANAEMPEQKTEAFTVRTRKLVNSSTVCTVMHDCVNYASYEITIPTVVRDAVRRYKACDRHIPMVLNEGHYNTNR